jgi:hypothetical protein
MNVWEVIFSALIVITIGSIFWAVGYWIVLLIARDCMARAEAEAVRVTDIQDAHRPPPLHTRPPPGCAVVQQPCDTLYFARVV